MGSDSSGPPAQPVSASLPGSHRSPVLGIPPTGPQCSLCAGPVPSLQALLPILHGWLLLFIGILTLNAASEKPAPLVCALERRLPEPCHSALFITYTSAFL